MHVGTFLKPPWFCVGFETQKNLNISDELMCFQMTRSNLIGWNLKILPCVGVSNPTQNQGVSKLYQCAFLTCLIIFLDKGRPTLAPR